VWWLDIIFFGATDGLLEKNVVTDNLFQGIIGYASSGIVLSHNVALRNGTIGIHQPDHGPPNGPVTFTHNIAHANGTLGIDAQPSAIGGHNRASGNGDPRQCVNVVCK
jgi:parallel beta-helix repeat protein